MTSVFTTARDPLLCARTTPAAPSRLRQLTAVKYERVALTHGVLNRNAKRLAQAEAEPAAILIKQGVFVIIGIMVFTVSLGDLVPSFFVSFICYNEKVNPRTAVLNIVIKGDSLHGLSDC